MRISLFLYILYSIFLEYLEMSGGRKWEICVKVCRRHQRRAMCGLMVSGWGGGILIIVLQKNKNKNKKNAPTPAPGQVIAVRTVMTARTPGWMVRV